MPRSSSYSHRKSSRSYSRDRDFKRRSSSDEDVYEKKRSHRRSRSPSSSSRSKISYRSRRRSNSSSDNDYYRKKKSSKSYKDKKSKKSKRSHRSPSTSSSISMESTRSSKSRHQKCVSPAINSISQNEMELKPIFDLNLLEGKINSEILEDIENDKFQSRTFSSNTSSKQTSQKVYIDLKKDTILVPTTNESSLQVNDSLFHPNFLGDEVEKSEKWIKKLWNFRQRMLHTS